MVRRRDRGLGKILMHKAVLLSLGVAFAPLLAATSIPAAAQPQGNAVIGPPQVGDFRLEPRQRIVTQPRPTPTEPLAQPPRAEPTATAERPAPARRAAEPSPRAAEPARQTRASASDAAPSAPEMPGATSTAPVQALPASLPVAAPPAPAAPIQAPVQDDAPALPAGPPLWVYFLALVVLGLLGYGYYLRRQAVERRLLALPSPRMAMTPAAATSRSEPADRPAPVPRAWIDIDIVPERVTVEPAETAVEFEMIVRNSGGSEAKNLKLQAKLFSSTPTQDNDLKGFFGLKPGGEQRTISAPPLPAGEEIRIKGRIAIKVEDVRALRVEERLLFIPLVAVNAFYDWGTGRSGQSSRTFIVGRERTDPSDKMAPFRMDLGARVYRNVGRRAYKLERRV
jgi:hypothetical protein